MILFLVILLLPILTSFLFYPLVLVIALMYKKLFCSQTSADLKNQAPKSMTILLPVFNEENFIEKKLENIQHSILLNPTIEIDVIVYNDGSKDNSATKISRWCAQNTGIKTTFINKDTNQGKWAGILEMTAIARGQILFISDISSTFQPAVIKSAIDQFVSSEVAVVSPSYSTEIKHSIWTGIYWRFSKLLRTIESQVWSTCGSHGSGYFIRKDKMKFLSTMPINSLLQINDDFIIPTLACKDGFRNIYLPSFTACELAKSSYSQEKNRRRRIAVGNIAMSKYLMQELSWEKDLLLKLAIIGHKSIRNYIFPSLLFFGVLLNFSFLNSPVPILLSNTFLILVFIFFPPAKASLQSFYFYYYKKKVSW